MAENQSSTAIVLMRMALALLNRDGNEVASAKLRRAIEAAVGLPPTEPTEDKIDVALAG